MKESKFKTLHVSLSEDDYFNLMALKARYHAKDWADLLHKISKE